MMKQLKEIFDPDISLSFSYDKKLQKCTSSTDMTTLRTKRQVKFPLLTQTDVIAPKPESKSRQMDEFIFCLKLKMISISRLFDNQQFDSDKIQEKDANQILNELSRKIKNFQKQFSKKYNQQTNKVRELEIVIINLQAHIKSLQADLIFSKKQTQKNSKTYSIDLRKAQSKSKQNEIQKQSLQIKLRSMGQIADEQQKIITRLQLKISQEIKTQKNLESRIFQKEKEIAKLTNQYNFQKIRYNQQCQGLKKSVLKTAQQNNRMNSQIKNLKEIVENKQKKIEELRNKNNKLISDNQKISHNNDNLTHQIIQLKQKQSSLLKNFEKQIGQFRRKQQQATNIINEITTKLTDKIQTLKQMAQRIHSVRMFQHQLQTQIQWMYSHTLQEINNLSNQFQKQRLLIQQQYEIQKKIKVQQTREEYQQKIIQLQNYLITLEKKLINC